MRHGSVSASRSQLFPYPPPPTAQPRLWRLYACDTSTLCQRLTTPVSMADDPPTAQSASGQGRGGRRRGRGGAAPPPSRTDSQQNPGQGTTRGSKSRGRGGKASGDRNKQRKSDESTDNKAPPPSTAATATKPLPAATDDADDGEICFICASTVEHTSVSPCNHRTCHICALRLRALYKSKGCAHCRVSRLLSPALRVLLVLLDWD